MDDFPWPPGAATGIGSLPGIDIAEALRTVLGELPDLPFLPELPARGPGADLVGRSGGLLTDLPLELYAARWRLAAGPGRDARRAADFWERDLDALTDLAIDYRGRFKVQAAGPWTLATHLELRTGGAALHDSGAVRDLVGALADGLRAHLAELSARVPGAQWLLQLDEPSLPAVLAGEVPTESGLATLPPVEEPHVVRALQEVVQAVPAPVVVHCCAPRPPLEVVRQTGAVGAAVDMDQLAGLDPVGQALDSGLGLLAGAVPTQLAAPPSGDQLTERMHRWWGRLGFPPERLPVQVVFTQACGLAGADPGYVRAAFSACREAARRH